MRSLLSVLAVSSFVLGAQNVNAQNSAKKSPLKKTTEVSSMELPLDVAASSLAWTGKKVSGQHTGTLKFKEGSFKVSRNGIVGGTIVIDLNTIVDTDLTDADYNKKLVTHLKSEDFFDVAKHPTAIFKIKKFTELFTFAPGGPNANVTGDLTIRGVTKPISFGLFYYSKDNGFEAKGKVLVERTQYGLKYNSKKFFSIAKLGDKMIDDTFEVELDIVAKK
jgi:polyisoprenoid-binding protein YceI